MTDDELERLAREAGIRPDNDLCGIAHVPAAALARFAALVRAQAEAEAHAAIDASPAQIVRNRLQGYPGTEDHVLTLVERIQALDKYATDYKRWCIEAEGAAMHVRAQALDEAARLCESREQAWLSEAAHHAADGNLTLRDLIARQAYGNGEAAAAIRALIPKD